MKKRLLIFRTCATALFALIVSVYAQASVELNSTNFPDANFRAAVSAATGVAEGGTITDAQISALTTLDVSDMGITRLRGLGYLTGLTYLDISDNSTLTTGADITDLTALTTLKASNCNLRDLSAISSGNYSGLTIGTGNRNIKYLDLSKNANFYYSGNLQYLTNLETLLLNDCTNFDFWGPAPGLAMSKLKWVDVSNCEAMDRIFLPAAVYLEHLNASGTLVKGFNSNASATATAQDYITLSTTLGSNGTLKYLNLSDCANLNSFRALSSGYNVASLDTLILTNDTNLGWSNTGFEAQTNLTYLDVTNCGISTSGSYIPNFTNLTNLKTLLYGENPDVAYLNISGNSNLTTLDLHDNSGMTLLTLANCGMPRTNLTINDTGCTLLTGLNLNDNSYATISAAVSDASTWGLDNVEFLYLENNSGFTGGALTLNASDCGSLKGLDLGNNGFTSFTAESLPATLTALMLGDNPSMTRLEMHNNPGIITMTASPTMSDGSGLYLLGNTALTYMDISGTADQPNYFQRIGNNSSLSGVPIDTLKASYNKFYTFRNLETLRTSKVYEYFENGTYYYATSDKDKDLFAWWNPSPAQPDSASLQDLTSLRYLDLRYCNLKDSVYLHKNTNLRYLDVSHNRTIERHDTYYYPDKGYGYRRAGGTEDYTETSYEDYRKYLWLVKDSTGLEPYTGDYNDTTGLYILDLGHNSLLEYLDISYTGIEQTAMTHCHVNNARFVWIQDLPNLKYFYADYNGMRSLGISTQNGQVFKGSNGGLKSLERLSAIGMRGADNGTMMGSINPNGNVCSPLHYINLSYSDYDSIGPQRCAQLDTFIIKGNPIHYLNMQSNPNIKYIDARECAFKMRGYDPETGTTYPPDVNTFKNGARTGGQYTDANTNDFPSNDEAHPVQSPFSGLRAVRAYNRPYLATVLLDSCNALRQVYCHDNPMLTKINGFEHLPYSKPAVDQAYSYPTQDADSLLLVWVHNNEIFNELNLTQNVNLQYLHAYNDKALGDALGSTGMNLNNNVDLRSAWVSNSNLQAFSNGTSSVPNANLDTLKIWDNPELAILDVTPNTGLLYFDLRNCMVRDLDMSKCSVLTYFDCSNDSINDVDGMWFNDALQYNCSHGVPTTLTEVGKNKIADLEFAGNSLVTMNADYNDLYKISGVSNHSNLSRMSYRYNHVNAIDLSGTALPPDTIIAKNDTTSYYDNTHNVRAVIPAELAQWTTTVNGNDTTYNVFYFQLDPDANDKLPSQGANYTTYLGLKAVRDTLTLNTSRPIERYLDDDNFNPAMVDTFYVNSSGPIIGTRTSNSLNTSTMIDIDPSSDDIDPSKLIGTVVILKKYPDPVIVDDQAVYYCEYKYFDGRGSSSSSHSFDSSGASSSSFGLGWSAPGNPTEVEETTEDGLVEATVVSERYFDINGAEHSEPIKGVNIIVRTMSDGTMQTIKVMK